MFGDLNNKPFQHMSSNGTEFNAEFGDLKTGVKVTNANKDILRYTQDVAEFTAFHVLFIRPELNGFAGYDAISFEII
jgi:hypothetical protein